MPTTTTIKAAAKKSSPRKSGRKAEFPAVVPMTPMPPLFVPKPLDPSDVKIGAVLKTTDGRVGTVKATGTHRVRLILPTGPVVLLRGQLAELVTPAPAKKTSGRKGGPKALKLDPTAPVPALAAALAGWEGVPRERLVEALKAALANLEK